MLLSIISTLFNIFGWILYLKFQWNGIIKSSPISWLLSFLIVLSTCISLLYNHLILISMPYFFGLIPCFLALYYSLKYNNKNIIITNNDKIYFLFAIFLLILSFKLSNISSLFISMYYLITYFLLLKNIILKKCVEYYVPWVFWSFSAFFNILNSLVIKDFEIFAYLIPITSFVCWSSIGISSYILSKK